MEPFSIIPSRALGPFMIGMPIGSALEYIQKHGMRMRNNEFLFHAEDPLSSDLVLTLLDCGLRLRFDARQQRLKLIDVFDWAKITMTYDGASLGKNGNTEGSFRSLYRVFGLTFPGSFDQKRCQYLLQYPGLCFVFALPKGFQDNQNAVELPLDLPDGSSPPVARLFIHSGSNVNQLSLPALKDHTHYFEPVHVYLNTGVLFTKRRRHITFNCSAQDLLTDFGPPSRILQKDRDQMQIHSHKAEDLSQVPKYHTTSSTTSSLASMCCWTAAVTASRKSSSIPTCPIDPSSMSIASAISS